jgi:recombination protein RecA
MPPKVKKTYTPPKSLDAFRTAQEKKYGDRVVRHEDAREMTYIPTGSIGLDMALGGGWARGRIHEVIGQPGVAKTSLCMVGMGEAQRQHKTLAVGYIDMERTWKWDWAEKLGVDTSKKRLIYQKPDSSEDVSDMLRDMLRSELFSLVVVDSVGGMERADVIFEKDAEQSDMGKNSQVISRLCKQVAVIGDNSNTATILVNQFRKDFGSMTGMDKASGPMILGYSTTDSVVLRRTYGVGNVEMANLDGDEIEVSRKIVARVQRSKIFVQGRKAEFFFTNADTDFGPVGIDQVGEIYMMAKKCGVLVPNTETSSWMVFPDGTKENGEKGCKARLRKDPKLAEEIRRMCVKTVEKDRIIETEVTFEPAG